MAKKEETWILWSVEGVDANGEDNLFSICHHSGSMTKVDEGSHRCIAETYTRKDAELIVKAVEFYRLNKKKKTKKRK